MAKEWDKFIKKIENDDDAYLILGGDLMNNATRASVSNHYEEKLPPSEQKKVLHDQLYQVKDKILCGVLGNHEARSVKDVDQDPLYDVFVMLGIQDRYRRNMGFMKVRLDYATYSFCIAHGASKTRTGQFVYALEGIDCLVTGHTHDPSIEMPSKLFMPNKGKNMSVRDMTKLVAPSWMAYGGYGMQKMYQPKVTGRPQHLELECTSRDKGAKKMRVIW